MAVELLLVKRVYSILKVLDMTWTMILLLPSFFWLFSSDDGVVDSTV